MKLALRSLCKNILVDQSESSISESIWQQH